MRIRSPRKKNGMILVITMLFMVILGFMALALFQLVPQDLRQSLRQEEDVQSHYAATSGIKHALAFLSAVRNADTDPTVGFANGWSVPNDPFAVPSSGFPYSVQTIADPQAEPLVMTPASNPDTDPSSDRSWYPPGMKALVLKPNQLQLDTSGDGNRDAGLDFSVQIYIFPDKWTWPHPNTGNDPNAFGGKNGAYTIVSLAWRDADGNGQCNGNERYKLRAKANVCIDTFAKYSYFYANPDPNKAIQLAPGQTRAAFDGPVHTNGYHRLLAGAGLGYWDDPAFHSTKTASESFKSELTFAGTAEGTPSYSTSGGVTLNYDKLLWAQGNWGSVDANKLPYDLNNQPISTRYSRLIANGESRIRSTKEIQLPTDVTKLAEAAWGPSETGSLSNQLSIVPNDSVYVNPKSSSSEAAGGVFIKGNVRQMTLQVLDGSGNSIGNGNLNSPVPSDANNGNSAIRVQMENQRTKTTVLSNKTVNVSQFAPSSYTKTSSWPQPVTGTVGPYPTTKTSTWSTGGGSSNVNYTGTCSSTKTTMVWGTNAQGVAEQVPSNYSVNYSCPKSSTKTWGGSPTTSSWPAMATSTKTYSTKTKTSSWPASTKTFTGFAPSTYPVTDTKTWRPEALVVEVNQTAMSLNSTAKTAGQPMFYSTSASFIVNGATQTQLNVNVGTAAVIQQSPTDPNFWQVTQLAMPAKVTSSNGSPVTNYQLNGAVQVHGNIGNPRQSNVGGGNIVKWTEGGLQGWNKQPRTIAAIERTYNGTSWVANPKALAVNGHIRSFGTSQGSQITGSNLYKHNLGLIGGELDINVANNQYTGNVAPFNNAANKELFIYAVMLATDRLNARNVVGESSSGAPLNWAGQTLVRNGRKATLRLFGGLLVNNQGRILLGDYGYSQEYNYDPQNAKQPPPFFPTLNDFVVYNYLEDRL